MMLVCQWPRRHLWELGVLKRLIVSPAVYPHLLEIAERGLSAIAELLVVARTMEKLQYTKVSRSTKIGVINTIM